MATAGDVARIAGEAGEAGDAAREYVVIEGVRFNLREQGYCTRQILAGQDCLVEWRPACS